MKFLNIENIFYKIKNNLFKFSKEYSKLKRPNYDELIKYKDFKKKENNNLVISFTAGRSGQNWISKIFNSHPNWIGSCERFSDFEAFYRYITYYKLPINKKEFFRLFKLATNKDMALHQNSFITSPYLTFGVIDLVDNLNPDFILYSLRDPVKTIEAFYTKGWYINYSDKDNISPSINITESQYRSFSRITPKGTFFYEWIKLTRIGKITWFWAEANSALYNSFKKIKNTNKFNIKLEDIDQNYEMYLRLAKTFNFEKPLKKRFFLNIINKAENKLDKYRYDYSNWSSLEKKEFEYIKNKFFPYYEEIKTNL